MKLNTLLLILGLAGIVFGKNSSADDLMQAKLEQEDLTLLVDDAKRFGDPARGAFVFFKPEMNCARCHDSQETGRRLGPDLAEIREVNWKHLAESILAPSKEIKQGFESVLVRTIVGELISGIFVAETDGAITLDRIEEPEKPLTVAADVIDDWKMSKSSSMPEQLVNQLTARQEFLDLVSYLAEIATYGNQRANELKPDDSHFVTAPLPEYESRVDHQKLMRSLDEKSFDRGREIYRLRCESCHGTRDNVGSMPTSLRFSSGTFKRGGDPLSMYMTLTHGYGMMNAQRWMVPKQKYDVIHYIREHFVKSNAQSQYTQIDAAYLANVPTGDTLGPQPKMQRPWSDMDYGPSLNNTIEASRNGTNIAQKGIIVRLDSGPGGVESGNHWVMYDHDTMRVAAAWSDEFIDFNGIHFNGVHGRHPKITGRKWYENGVGPGWAHPQDFSFEDRRLVGRDGKNYGPLPRGWLDFKGLYRFGQRTLLKYSIGDNSILESPVIQYVDGAPLMQRQFYVPPNQTDLVIQVLRTDQKRKWVSSDSSTIVFGSATGQSKPSASPQNEFEFDGHCFAQIRAKLDMSEQDFTVYAEIRSGKDGTIFSQTTEAEKWVENGKSFFIHDRRLHYDIGWVGVLASDAIVDDNKWQKVAIVWQAKSGATQFFVEDELIEAGTIRPTGKLQRPVHRIGFTNPDFPSPTSFTGQMRNVRFYARCLNERELTDIDNVKSKWVGQWNAKNETEIQWLRPRDGGPENVLENHEILVHTTLTNERFVWESTGVGDLRMRIKSGNEPINFSVGVHASTAKIDFENWQAPLAELCNKENFDLHRMLTGGPSNWPQVLTTEIVSQESKRGFQVDVLERPVTNPWNDRMRLTGIDFLSGGNDAVVCCWDGSVYRVSGLNKATTNGSAKIEWRRIAAGLFQPLGIRVVADKIYVGCRDQIVRLHDLNGDGEMDWYENFNSDHQVTEHFHEFAMGLQTDDAGNFYYAKSARHALEAVVPHHGTLIRVSKDGAESEIVATGFRAANGVCLNPDGTFIVTDQEGHWNPKNRINWVRQGGFYGNMFGFHNVTDTADEAMEPPLCWITNAFDRSPGELLWVTSDRWQSLQGSLLNLSYGTGQIFVVPHENAGSQVQGGMCALPIGRFPTGIMRGRFNENDGQLYCCGMFAWAGDQQAPGGLYRVSHTGEAMHLPVKLQCTKGRIRLTFTDKLDSATASDAKNFRIESWDIKRTKNYGSPHFNEKRIAVAEARLLTDQKTIELLVPELKETWCMKIQYAIEDLNGMRISGEIHNTIHQLPESE